MSGMRSDRKHSIDRWPARDRIGMARSAKDDTIAINSDSPFYFYLVTYLRELYVGIVDNRGVADLIPVRD